MGKAMYVAANDDTLGRDKNGYVGRRATSIEMEIPSIRGDDLVATAEITYELKSAVT